MGLMDVGEMQCENVPDCSNARRNFCFSSSLAAPTVSLTAGLPVHLFGSMLSRARHPAIPYLEIHEHARQLKLRASRIVLTNVARS